MSDLVHAIAARAEAPSGIPAHYHVAKQEAPFRVLVSNDTGNEVIFEFYVQYLHSLIR